MLKEGEEIGTEEGKERRKRRYQSKRYKVDGVLEEDGVEVEVV